ASLKLEYRLILSQAFHFSTSSGEAVPCAILYSTVAASKASSWLAHTGYSRANQRYVSSPSHRSDGVIPFAAIMLSSAVPRNGTLSGYFPFGLSSTPYMRTTYLPS